MRYSFISAAVLAFASSVLAQTAGFDAITSPTQDQNIPAGSSFDIIWQPGTETGLITITLLQGADPAHLQAGPVIAASINNALGKYTWSVPTTSSFATYGFEIVLDSTAKSPSPTLQYSFPFHITGGTSSSSSATGKPSTTTLHLSHGPSYTTSSSSSSSSSPSSVTSTYSVYANTTSSSNSTRSSTSSSSIITTYSVPSSNVTLHTKTITPASTSASSIASATLSTPAAATHNAAASNMAGSIAMIGGFVLAFAL